MKETIQNYIMINNWDMIIELATTNPDDILESIAINRDDKSIFFLDVDLKREITGIKLGLEIRKRVRDATIAFVTTHAELAYLTFMYKVEAIDYITKDDTVHFESRIREVLDVVMERYKAIAESSDSRYTIQEGENFYTLEVGSTLYFESSPTPNKISVVLMDRQLDFYGKIKDLPLLSSKFIRCHQSYVVNIDYVIKVDSKKRIAYMSNGDECLISMRYKKTLMTLMKDKQLE
ncbi:MAG: response regulator transcription factor [Enterococcus lacertideformus]|uniref:Response regulator transcription factor n=1 Tax=Enterococcus lacertideformus TaxID=2771493 RepID=A0A931AV30_9ENTE|nr:response regulator transcription factor [Enterococcus lacertideformus]